MWQWLNQNAQALSLFTSVGTLLVWLFYAQLLLLAFKRQRQARVLINQGWGNEVDSVCLVSNMSQEPVYIQCIFIRLHTADGDYQSSVTDFDDVQPEDSLDSAEHITRQGPLESGKSMNLGTFRRLIGQAARQHDLRLDETDPVAAIGIKEFTITVVSNYGPESEPIGIARDFTVDSRYTHQLRPKSIYTRRLTTRRARRRMRRWLERTI